MKKLAKTLMIFTPVMFCLLMIRCTLIGLLVGSSIDSSKPEYTTLSGWKIASIQTGKKIVLYLYDGKAVTGKFQGIEKISQELYQERYGQAIREIPDLELLTIGNEITLTNEMDRSGNYLFQGFDPDVLLVSTLDQRESGQIRLKGIKEIKTRYGMINTDNLKNLMSQNRLPVYSTIIIGEEPISSQNRISIPMNDIYQIEYKNSKNATVMGAVVGATFDAIIIVSAINFNPMEDFHLSFGE